MWAGKIFQCSVRSSPFIRPTRGLKLLEHVGMEVLREGGVKTPNFKVARALQDIAGNYRDIASKGSTEDAVLKAQVLTGGRGKGKWDSGLQGGVRIVMSENEAMETAKMMLGHRLFTKQTGAQGTPCNALMVAERKFLRHECYVAMVLDRNTVGAVLLGCAEGGVNIEEYAKEHPDKLVKLFVDITKGLSDEEAVDFARRLRMPTEQSVQDAAKQVKAMYNLFLKRDCTFLEINPLAVDVKGEVMCVDCKIHIDDNAKGRQKDLFEKRDISLEDARDVRAEKVDINYIGLDGNIACLVNGAGLAMATMDLIKLHGGNPANFLDVGGGADAQQITEAFRIILEDPKVQAIFVNIFGGILRCDAIANGIIQALNEIKTEVPIVVRLQGTHVKEAKDILKSGHKKLISIDDLDRAARTAVKMADISEMAKQASIGVEFTTTSLSA
ncbi:unnamed protein product [Calicophoron daubneyi]|uniref:Succinate--CoA ligase [ADP-forming] subunit beta, mitochondrial n=1 Tax=Calicophoron daubneyi TaxID=300641 RepID=A0AAV2TVG1_CALDB